MGIETEYDDDFVPPVTQTQTAGDRSAQQLTVNIGMRSLSVMTRSAFVSGVCAALCVVCTGICWWAITENRVTQERLQTLSVQHATFEPRLATLEKGNARD